MKTEEITARWQEAAQRVCDTTNKKKNQSRELETVRNAVALLEEFEDRRGDTNDPGTVSLLVDLSKLARDTTRSKKYAERLLKLSERGRAKAIKELIESCYKSGDYEAVRKYAEKIPRDSLNTSTRKRLSNLDTAKKIHAQFEQANAVVNHPSDARLTDDIVAKIGNHLEPEKAARLRSILREIPSAVDSSISLSPNKNLNYTTPLNLIFCGGFRWSGASAVCDFLADYSNANRAPMAARFFTGPGFTIRSIETAFRNGDKNALVVQMRGFTLQVFAGIMIEAKKAEKEILDHWKTSVAAQNWQKFDDEIVSSAVNFFRGIMIAINSEARIFPSKAFQSFVYAIMRLILPNNTRTVLFDSVIRAPDCDMVALLPNAKMFCVLRDPRDMFVTQFTRKSATWNVEPYIQELKDMHASYKAALNSACTTIQFEEFVQSEKCRDLVKQIALGNDANAPQDPVFNPKDSMTNIGVYRQHKKDPAIMALAEAFPEFCRNE